MKQKEIQEIFNQRGYLCNEEYEELLSKATRLLKAIEKHKKRVKNLSKVGGFPISDEDKELYKAAEEE